MLIKHSLTNYVSIAIVILLFLLNAYVGNPGNNVRRIATNNNVNTLESPGERGCCSQTEVLASGWRSIN